MSIVPLSVRIHLLRPDQPIPLRPDTSPEKAPQPSAHRTSPPPPHSPVRHAPGRVTLWRSRAENCLTFYIGAPPVLEARGREPRACRLMSRTRAPGTLHRTVTFLPGRQPFSSRIIHPLLPSTSFSRKTASQASSSFHCQQQVIELQKDRFTHCRVIRPFRLFRFLGLTFQ